MMPLGDADLKPQLRCGVVVVITPTDGLAVALVDLEAALVEVQDHISRVRAWVDQT